MASPSLGIMDFLDVSTQLGLWSSFTEPVNKPAFVSPGIKWTPDENGVITFDCRNRGW